MYFIINEVNVLLSQIFSNIFNNIVYILLNIIYFLVIWLLDFIISKEIIIIIKSIFKNEIVSSSNDLSKIKIIK